LSTGAQLPSWRQWRRWLIDRYNFILSKFLSKVVSSILAQTDLVSPLTRLQGGYETATYRFELDGAPADLSGPLVLRLYPQFYGTQNAIWESTVQNVLAAEGYPVARAHLVCADMSTLDGAFFIMDYLPGQPLAAAPPDSIPRLNDHHHSGLGLLTPVVVHYGQAQAVLDQRQKMLQAVYAAHPERFVRGEPKPSSLPTEVWINKPPPSS